MRRALRLAALRTVWLLIGAAIGLAAVLLLVSLAQVVGGSPGLVIPLCLLPALLLGLLPGVRELEVTAGRSLLGLTGDLVVPALPSSATDFAWSRWWCYTSCSVSSPPSSWSGWLRGRWS